MNKLQWNQKIKMNVEYVERPDHIIYHEIDAFIKKNGESRSAVFKISVNRDLKPRYYQVAH